MIVASILLGTLIFLLVLDGSDVDDDDDFGGGMMIPAYNPTN
jgi:hypothetical protein